MYVKESNKGNNILVAVRARPVNKKEAKYAREKGLSDRCIKVIDEKIVMIKDISGYKPEEAFRGYREKEKTYAFDHAFNQDVDQHYVFEKTTKSLIKDVLKGFNATVFAYGATGAGKTYTMMGEEGEDGVMLLSIQELFDQIEYISSERDYQLKISYIEVYNENIRDLISPSDKYLDLREDPIKGMTVAGVTEIMTTNTEDIMYLLREGNEIRTKEATAANAVSSRSHAVLQIIVENKDRAHGVDSDVNIGKLSMIDLAGSERASATLNTGKRLIEGANINRSLLALANCINALCSKTEKGGAPHIPYRDSKLTRFLKDSLGGNCRTVMIANISPSFMTYEDTLNTLKYADRAKQIKTVVKRNVLNVEYHISNYKNIISNLRSEISTLRGQLKNSKTDGSTKLLNKSDTHFLPRLPPSTGTPKSSKLSLKQADLKQKQLNMGIHFEKEATIRKQLLELERDNENQAFDMFRKEMDIRKMEKSDNPDTSMIESNREELHEIKYQIEENSHEMSRLQDKLAKLEKDRKSMLIGMKTDLDTNDSVEAVYNQHLLNLKDMEFVRKEKQAQFHIKQKEMYI